MYDDTSARPYLLVIILHGVLLRAEKQHVLTEVSQAGQTLRVVVTTYVEEKQMDGKEARGEFNRAHTGGYRGLPFNSPPPIPPFRSADNKIV